MLKVLNILVVDYVLVLNNPNFYLGFGCGEWSSTVTIKLNANCCSYCKGHPYAFGIYLSNKEENCDLGFDSRHRICMQQWDLLSYGPIESSGAVMLNSIY